VSAEAAPAGGEVASFRRRVLWAMMVVVSGAAILLLLFIQRNMAQAARAAFQREFAAELAALHAAEDVRHASLAERSRVLARKSRIHAALEDGAPELLYPSARDELLDLAGPDEGGPRDAAALRARYYRFLDGRGRVIRPVDAQDVGELEPADEPLLALPRLPDTPQTGYIRRGGADGGQPVDELIAMPIISSENGETIAALVMGFKPESLAGATGDAPISGGILLGGRLDLPTMPAAPRADLERALNAAVAAGGGDAGELEFRGAGAPDLVFFKRLNPGSAYPPAYEVSVDSLAASVASQRRLGWEFAAAGLLVLAGAYLASHVLSRRLSAPVERLAVDAEANRAHRHRAEAALETTSQELQRAARFSADASHQLKTPVTVLRAGLEGLLAGHELGPEAREEVAGLVHQTFRLASVIEDLLLLSRLDAGRLQIQFSRVNLTPLLEALLDDVGATPDLFDLEVDADLPPELWITGEKSYATLVLENLLENARKYNQTRGRIGVVAVTGGEWVVVAVGNTGPAIPRAAQEHIFERFHRGAVGENVPGHGIGLNLARELARLHGGDLRLARSDDTWTEFELRFRAAPGEGTPP
jgi:signal transduction histidine kinase